MGWKWDLPQRHPPLKETPGRPRDRRGTDVRGKGLFSETLLEGGFCLYWCRGGSLVVGHHGEAGGLRGAQIGGQGGAGVARAVGAGGGRVDRAGGGRRGEGGQDHASLIQGALVGDRGIISELLEGQVGLEYLQAEEGELEAGWGGLGRGPGMSPQEHKEIHSVLSVLLGVSFHPPHTWKALCFPKSGSERRTETQRHGKPCRSRPVTLPMACRPDTSCLLGVISRHRQSWAQARTLRGWSHTLARCSVVTGEGQG